MNTFQKNALFLALVFLALGGVAMGAYFGYRNHEAKVAEQRKAWNKENIRSLESLSQIGALSTEEQDRLDRAGDDIDHIQQVLLDLHTERHTIWTAHKRESDDRARKLQALTSLSGYGYDDSYREVAIELRKEHAMIDDNLAGYERGYANIKAWRPISFDVYQAGALSVGVVGYGSSPSANQHLTSKPTPNEAEPTIREVNDRVTPGSSESERPSTAQSALDNVDVEVAQALRSWSSAMEGNNPHLIADCYADHVDRYFLKLDVSKDQVQDYMTDWLGHESKHISSFSVKDVTFENETGSTAKLRLVKNMTLVDQKGSSNLVIRSRLYLRKENGEWKITSEQDFKN